MFELTIKEYIQIAILGGLLGTGAMTIVLYIIDRSAPVNSDMVRAIGSMITKSYENSFIPGLIAHIFSGIIFAIIYALVIDFLNPSDFATVVGYGTALGMFHGAAVGLMLVVSVAEHHPLEKFQKVGISVAVAHWIAHVIYGLVIGLIVGVTSF